MSHPLAIQRSNHRSFGDADRGLPVLFWDIDKTYLNTHFSTWQGLAGIPFESAVDKQPIAGSVPLLQALRHGPDPHSRLTPLYFVSASPPQLRKVLQRRMVLDGIDFDGLSFKDQLRLIRRAKFRSVGNHVAYKIGALLEYMQELPEDSPLYFFGDDAEHDADILALFGQICSGEKRGKKLQAALQKRRVRAKDAEIIDEITSSLPYRPRLQQIYIHRIRGRKIESLAADLRLVVATDNFFQQALHLLTNKMLTTKGALDVGLDLLAKGWTRTQLNASLDLALEQYGLAQADNDLLRQGLKAAANT